MEKTDVELFSHFDKIGHCGEVVKKFKFKFLTDNAMKLMKLMDKKDMELFWGYLQPF